MSPPSQLDSQVRLAAFNFLEEQVRVHGEVLPWEVLRRGFEFRGQPIKLLGPQGIFKPKILSDYPLSIKTVAPKPGQPRPYDDGFQPDGSVLYCYRGTDPAHHENVGLRRAMADHIPLIYFHGIVPGQYIASWPVYVVGDEPERLAFHVDVDGAVSASRSDLVAEPDLSRRYGVRTTHQRLHQQAFRQRVLRAYRQHCAVCRLRHQKLLDAAHIVPDSDPEGEPRVSNGLSLCKLHHAAFDTQLFGIRPDFVIEVRSSILEESDGPMLRHGLQEIDGSRIILPSRAEWRPDGDALERRYAEFDAVRDRAPE
ncbi:MAG: HNH endonuclease [Myxococcota bacterium]